MSCSHMMFLGAEKHFQFNPNTLNLTSQQERFQRAGGKSENIKKLSGDTFINMMNCSWTRHLVLPRTRKVWFMIASKFTVRKQYRGNYRHLRISVIQINDHITQRVQPDPAELHSLTACFETLINSWRSYNLAQWWDEKKKSLWASILLPPSLSKGEISAVIFSSVMANTCSASSAIV